MPEGGAVLVTCEHGGNRVPGRYAHLFAGQEALLASHRGWDPGTLSLGRALARRIGAPLHYSRTSRLLVDLNRSLHHHHLFSAVTRGLPEDERERILRNWYRPHREKVRAAVEGRIASGETVLHLAMHSFTPVLEGKARRVEIGLLFDPAREKERTFCHGVRRGLVARLGRVEGPLRVRLNQPYRGVADGFPTWLRGRFPPDRYLGIEVEVSQGLILGGGPAWRQARSAILDALEEGVCQEEGGWAQDL